ncbi:MAG: Lhr family helicase, partial [Polyangiaceae bacterium]
LSIERLEALRTHKKKPLQRLGLSATQRPLDEIARLLGGFDKSAPRPVTIIDAGDKKRLELKVEVPDIDMARLGEILPTSSGPAAGGGERRSIWPLLHERLVELVRAHRSTMIFVNSRRLAERLAGALNELAGEEIALAHHGSVAREKRMLVEDRLKSGDLPCIVATSSLELGIDMGAVDLVVQIEAPPSIASGMQRVGRGGHTVGAVSKGILCPKHRGDLLACATAVARMTQGLVEETFYPRAPLDVLAQQIVAIVATAATTESALLALVRRAAPYAELTKTTFDGVLDMLSGRYPSDEFAELRPRITWDRVSGSLRAREGAARLAITNGGTIPDRGLYGVFLRTGADDKKGGKRVGELDEEMVFEMREGDVFVLGASSWRIDEIALGNVYVVPAPGEPGRMPFWHGDRAGRSAAFGEAIGQLARLIASSSPADARDLLSNGHGLDEHAARNCIAFVAEQIEATGDVPSDKTIVVERFLDEIGDWRICILSPYGARIHAPWATAIVARLRASVGGEADVVWSDDGIAFRVTGVDQPPPTELFFPSSIEIERLVTSSLAESSLFAARFRENAARALLLPRRKPGQRTPLWAQRRRATDLLSVASKYPSFPILLETYRECLRDVFDMRGLVELLRRVESRRIRVTTSDRDKASPFAGQILFSFVANFIYEGDAPLAERRAQALTIDHAQLRELLGDAEARTLLDPEVILSHERMLQRLERPARHADALHDMLLSLGDLSLAEAQGRVSPPDEAKSWLAELVSTRRAIEVSIGGELRFVAAEDAGRLRDALGVVPPRGLPRAFLEPVEDAFADLAGRYARTHGPFTLDKITQRFGASASTVADALTRLVRKGRVVEGAFLPHGSGREFCGAEVLRAIRHRTLARLRAEVEPVDAPALGRFVPNWQGVGRRRRGRDALRAAIAQLEGCPIPASVLETEVLPARVEGFKPWDLDALSSSGEVVWAGIESLGQNDGRVALYLAEHEALLARPAEKVEGELAAGIRELLERRGAIFFHEITRQIGGFPADVAHALWDLVWAGEVTNDTCEPLRSYLRGGKAETNGRRTRAWRNGTNGGGAPLPGTEGRWSLRAGRWFEPRSMTERGAALARTLLERYGVVTREAVQSESVPGGFSAVYRVFKAMEDAGHVRRGYFVAGRGAAQFALPGADDRLRSMRDADDARTFVLASTDPANPFGAILPWPLGDVTDDERSSQDDVTRPRPQRAAGTRVVIHDGMLIGFLSRAADQLLTFLPRDEPEKSDGGRALAEALAGIVDSGRAKALFLTLIDGFPANTSPLAPALARAGFQMGARGLLRRRTLSFGAEADTDDLDGGAAKLEEPVA